MKKTRLAEFYQEKIKPQLKQELKIKNDLAVPYVEKVVVNIGLKEAADDKGVLKSVSEYLAQITGQKPKVTRARKSIAGFSLREGSPVGLKVTLRHAKMYQFLDKLFNIVLPRVRDFQGVKLTAFDHQANYTLGLEEQTVFSEVDYDKIDKSRGLEITIVTSVDQKDQAKRLLQLMGMPFEKETNNG